MAWLSDLASALGMPAGAAALAAAMYVGCAAAEKMARPEALRDIAVLIKNFPKIRPHTEIKVVQKLFVLVFGDHQISQACLLRSAIATIFMCLSAFLVFRSHNRHIDFTILSYSREKGPLDWLGRALSIIFVFGIIPDYLAVGKTRIILSICDNVKLSPVMLFITDLFLSILISISLIIVIAILARRDWVELYNTPLDVFRDDISTLWNGSLISPYIIFLGSTAFTSIWILLVILSKITLSALGPISRFALWFYDVDNHPVKALGLMSASLIMAVSVIWAVIKVFI